jgi:hypothetical protein
VNAAEQNADTLPPLDILVMQKTNAESYCRTLLKDIATLQAQLATARSEERARCVKVIQSNLVDFWMEKGGDSEWIHGAREAIHEIQAIK